MTGLVEFAVNPVSFGLVAVKPSPARQFSILKHPIPELHSESKSGLGEDILPDKNTRRWLSASTQAVEGKVPAFVESAYSVDGCADPKAHVAFENLIQLKTDFATFAIHLDGVWRSNLFRRLNMLLSHDDWADDSSIVKRESFLTFLRFVVFSKPAQLPGLGVGESGNVLASWVHGDDKISVEFGERDQACAFFLRPTSEGRETFSFRGNSASLAAFIQRNGFRSSLETANDG